MPLLQTHAPSHSIVGDGVSGRSVRRGGRARRNVVTHVVGLFVLAFTILVLGNYYDQFWWPANEGHYAHRAERILDGDVLNRDVQDIRPGAVTLLSALIFRVLGEDLISLRYPLALAAVVQAMLIFFVVSPRGPLVAAAAAMSLTALSFIQFLNPAAHWYALFLLIVIIAALAWFPPDRRGRLEPIGFLVMTLLLFRQLTGIFAAMGVLTYLLCEAERAAAPPGAASWAVQRSSSWPPDCSTTSSARAISSRLPCSACGRCGFSSAPCSSSPTIPPWRKLSSD